MDDDYLKLILISLIQEPLHLKEVSTKRNESIDQDDDSCNSILTNNDETVPIEKNNHHNIVVADEGFKVPSNLKYLADDDDLIPTVKSIFLNHLLMQIIRNIQRTKLFLSMFQDLLYGDGLSLDDLLAEPEATNISNWIQNQYITNTEDGKFLNSIADNNEAYLKEGNTQQCLAADNEGFGLPCIGVMMESSNSMEKSRKRPRLQYDGLNHHVETAEAQPWGEEYPSSSKSIQAGSRGGAT